MYVTHSFVIIYHATSAQFFFSFCSQLTQSSYAQFDLDCATFLVTPPCPFAEEFPAI